VQKQPPYLVCPRWVLERKKTCGSCRKLLNFWRAEAAAKILTQMRQIKFLPDHMAIAEGLPFAALAYIF
jgi:hypothetical protein